MTLIKSISGIRGTIGGTPGDNLTPDDIVKYTAAYAAWLRVKTPGTRLKVVIGRDARISGPMVENLVIGTLMGCGIDVINVGLCTTPGVEMAVVKRGANGGIIITASHNPKQWNALKLLNGRGEFLSSADGEKILELAEAGEAVFPHVDLLGKVIDAEPYQAEHIEEILALPLVDAPMIRQARYKIVVDAVNSVGGIVIPELLEKLGAEVICINCVPDGNFAHNPEPLPENLTEISEVVIREKADLGIVVDPDVDRLALVCEDGTMFGEEYTLVAVADYVLSCEGGGNTVSNLSSTRALKDVTDTYGGKYYASAVGEVNVVEKMKEVNAVIGGEGNGGIIYPALHYGRDALVGIALFLTHLARAGVTVKELRKKYPDYYISKNKIELVPGTDVDSILENIKRLHAGDNPNTVDGLRIDLPEGWVHMRRSNTEPIIRIYSESDDIKKADELADTIMKEIRGLS